MDQENGRKDRMGIMVISPLLGVMMQSLHPHMKKQMERIMKDVIMMEERIDMMKE